MLLNHRKTITTCGSGLLLFAGLFLFLCCQSGLAGPRDENRGRLWQISLDGEVRGYLLGTMHLDDPQIANLGPGIIDTLAASEKLLVEVLMTPAAISEYQARVWAADAGELATRLSPQARASLADIVGQYGLNTDVALRLQPWALLNLVSRPPPSGKPVLDELLIQRAEEINLPAIGLGSMSSLIGRLESIDTADTMLMLEDSIEHHDAVLAEIEQMRSLYLDGDIQGLEALTLDNAGDEAVAKRFFDKLLYERTERWLAKIGSALEDEISFIAVGALHLAGERGLLHLLRSRGYDLLALDPDKPCPMPGQCAMAY